MEIEWLQGTCLAITAVKEPPSEEKALTWAVVCCRSAENCIERGFSVKKIYSGSYTYYFWFYYGTGLPGVR